jgi:hypothetical protein
MLLKGSYEMKNVKIKLDLEQFFIDVKEEFEFLYPNKNFMDEFKKLTGLKSFNNIYIMIDKGEVNEKYLQKFRNLNEFADIDFYRKCEKNENDKKNN